MDYTINIMSVINFILVLTMGMAGWFAFRSRVDTVLVNLKEVLDKLTERFEKHEEGDRAMFGQLQAAITHLVGDVSRLIGRVESDTPVPLNRRRADKS